MKWIFISILVLFAAWKVTVFFMTRNAAGGNLIATDSLQANKPLEQTQKTDTSKKDSVKSGYGQLDTIEKKKLTLPTGVIDTRGVHPKDVIAFAKTLKGIPYLYASTDPQKGFDCSGFITYVFKHFNIVVPRSSIDFTNVGKEVSAANAKEGDLILFTGTDSTEHFVGHMGLVVNNTDSLRFIHSTSGKAHSVTITPLGTYYKSRYVKTVRIFAEND